MARQNINIGITANDKTGDPVRTAFTKTNANFTELYTNIASISNDMLNTPTDISDLTDTTGILIAIPPSSLVNNNKQVSLDAAGTLIVPNSANNYTFQMVLSTANYVSTLIKPTLPLISAPWSFNTRITYNNSGIAELVIVSGSLPSATNPGYSIGDTFTFNTTIHGIPNYTLIITLTDVTNPGFTVWNATLTPSSLPEYPPTIKSLGPIKLTANASSWIFGTDGKLIVPAGGDIVNNAGTSVLSGGVSTDIYKFASGVIGTKNDPDTNGWGSYNIVLDPGGESNAGLFIPSVAAQDNNSSLNIYNNRAVGNDISLLVNAGSFVFKGTGNLQLPLGSVINETASTISIAPPTAAAGQSLVIRPTAALWSVNSSGFISYGNPITISVTLSSFTYFGTINYEITGPGVTEQSLGRPTTGKLTFAGIPSIDTQTVTWTIPANSDITEFTFTITSVDGTRSNDILIENDPALYYSFEFNALPVGYYVTVTTDNITNLEFSHVHLVAGDPVTVDLYLGDDDQFVKIEKNGGNVVVGTNLNTKNWTFGTDGSLVLPGGSRIETQYGGDTRLVLDGTTQYVDIRSSIGILVGNNSTGTITIGGANNLTEIVSDKVVFINQSVPVSSVGDVGDSIGRVAFDGAYMYYCTGSYDGVNNIWKRVAWSVDTW